jgi:hypothetical protein
MSKQEALQIAKTLRAMAEAAKGSDYGDGKAAGYLEAAEMIEEAVAEGESRTEQSLKTAYEVMQELVQACGPEETRKLAEHAISEASPK